MAAAPAMKNRPYGPVMLRNSSPVLEVNTGLRWSSGTKTTGPSTVVSSSTK